jgi:CheY-like chemotaxis protein
LPRTVLLADDSVTAQNMGRRILMDAGYEVITVNNGSAALKKIHESRPDMIVLDVYMPGYGGLEVCQRLKESGDTMRIPVLLTVGKMEPFKADEAKRVRADGHIIKPFEAAELLAAVTRLEDRIVPQAVSSSSSSRISRPKKSNSNSNSNSAEKKSRFWSLDEPSQEETDRSAEISRLAEAKQKEQEDQASRSGAETETATVEPTAAEELAAETPAVQEPPDQKETVQEQAVSNEDDQAPVTFATAEQPASVSVDENEPAAEFSISKVEYEGPPSDDSVSSVSANPEAASVEQSVVPPAPRWVAESVALTAEEASIALEQEMQQANASTQNVEATQSAEATKHIDEPATSEVAPAELPPVRPDEAGVAFAAAASSSGNVTAASAGTGVATGADTHSQHEIAAPSEAAAAWENWQQIRDSVMAPQQTAAIAESVAEIAQSAAPAPETASAPAIEGEALAGLVDSVLAELKPKLMAEIAKKLSQEKEKNKK